MIQPMNVYSVEEGDTILFRADYYRVSEIEGTESGYRLHLTDEEGFAKIMDVLDGHQVRVLVEEN